MNEDITNRLRASAEQLSLSKEEMLEGRAMLQAMIDAPHAAKVLASAKSLELEPLELATARVKLREKMHAMPPKENAFSFGRFLALLSGTLAMLGSGGWALVFAAESALPTDFLYPVKVHVNEPIVELFRRTPEEKAVWAVERFERRIGEVDTLAERKQLQHKITLMMATSIEEARSNAEQKTTDLASEQAKFILQHRMNAVTGSQERFFRKLVKDGMAPADVSPIIRATETKKSSRASSRMSDNNDADTSSDASTLWHVVPRPGPSKDRESRKILDQIQASFRSAAEKSSREQSSSMPQNSSEEHSAVSSAGIPVTDPIKDEVKFQ